MLRTPAYAALGSALPICQAGMANHTSPELVAAVWQAERDDNPDGIALMAGSGVGAITSLLPAGEVAHAIATRAEVAIAQLAGYISAVPARPEWP